MKRVHPVFHISLLEPAPKSAKTEENIEIDSDEDKYEVIKVLDYKQVDGRPLYLVKWKGYSILILYNLTESRCIFVNILNIASVIDTSEVRNLGVTSHTLHLQKPHLRIATTMYSMKPRPLLVGSSTVLLYPLGLVGNFQRLPETHDKASALEA